MYWCWSHDNLTWPVLKRYWPTFIWICIFFSQMWSNLSCKSKILDLPYFSLIMLLPTWLTLEQMQFENHTSVNQVHTDFTLIFCHSSDVPAMRLYITLGLITVSFSAGMRSCMCIHFYDSSLIKLLHICIDEQILI